MSYHPDNLPGEKPPPLSKADLVFLLMWTAPCGTLILAFVLTYLKHLLGVK